MAENDFLSGLLGGVKDVGGSIYGGISGLLGGGEQAPAGGNQMQDMLSQLSPADQKRLMFSTLGQLGATLMAAGQKQSGESRAQALAQLGKIGPGIEESMQRTAALQQQRVAAQRLAELFPLQKQQLQGQIGAQEIAQQAAQRENELFPLRRQQLQGQVGVRGGSDPCVTWTYAGPRAAVNIDFVGICRVNQNPGFSSACQGSQIGFCATRQLNCISYCHFCTPLKCSAIDIVICNPRPGFYFIPE